jgi:hypothetical protein
MSGSPLDGKSEQCLVEARHWSPHGAWLSFGENHYWYTKPVIFWQTCCHANDARKLTLEWTARALVSGAEGATVKLKK